MRCSAMHICMEEMEGKGGGGGRGGGGWREGFPSVSGIMCTPPPFPFSLISPPNLILLLLITVVTT